MMCLVLFGCDRFWSVFFFTSALTINGAVTAGYLGNGLDIAPNFSGTIFGLANTLSSSGGYISTFMVGVFTNNNVKPKNIFQQKITLYEIYVCSKLLTSGARFSWC